MTDEQSVASLARDLKQLRRACDLSETMVAAGKAQADSDYIGMRQMWSVLLGRISRLEQIEKAAADLVHMRANRMLNELLWDRLIDAIRLPDAKNQRNAT